MWLPATPPPVTPNKVPMTAAPPMLPMPAARPAAPAMWRVVKRVPRPTPMNGAAKPGMGSDGLPSFAAPFSPNQKKTHLQSTQPPPLP